MEVTAKDHLEHDAFLEHYGILGMKWGVRKERYNTIREARKKIFRDSKEAKKEIKRYKKESTKGLKNFAVSNDVNRAYKESKKRYTIKRNIEKMKQKRYDKNIDNIAAYRKAKKYRKSNEEQIKAEQKAYAKISSIYGKMGSVGDQLSGNQATHLYERLKKEKGEAYANEVAKRANRRVNARAAAYGAAILASYGFMIYELNK